MKRAVVVVSAAFAVSLAVVIGYRMSAEAMAVVVGVVCGVVASVPTSLLLVWALARRGQANGAADGQGRVGPGSHYPPVVVVNPGPGYGVSAYGMPPLSSAERSLPPPTGPRTFKVVGQEETRLDDVRHIFSGLAESWED